MRETTSALSRVALLVLMTGMFAAVWSNDQQTQSDFIIARREAAEQMTQFVHVIPTHVEVPPQVTVEMNLPVDITSGRFRVVQPSGAMFTINISATHNISAVPRDIYIMEVAEAGRMCFIRIDGAEVDLTKTRSAHVTESQIR